MTDYKNDTHTIFVPDEYFKPSYNRMFEGFKSFEELTDKEKRQIVNTLDKFSRIAAESLRGGK